ncbi:MAG TPA: UDP-N-acetylmuramoyl-tripeptide--D-alanyl-D-alanine ligase [Saprospiraceae bacterium]|nr:UDP-N-acetylmuramoyl-tripeptide--D-alanyl-D-alanine ligase [Saprospiraceae bacterium]
MDIELLYTVWLEARAISTDSRKIVVGSIFFALRGDRFDGNTFATQALELGASYVVVDDESVVVAGDRRYIFVEDVLTSLQQLANKHRSTLSIPVLALTGSNGKTTTKELARNVLSKKFKTHATEGNLNNHIGVPLTILSTPDDAQFLIVEMGANHQGEIDLLCQIAAPNYGMITNIGKAHLEGFGGVEGIKKGKSEMYRYLAQHGGKIFINSDDNVLMSLLPEKVKTIQYEVQTLLNLIDAEPTLKLDYRNVQVTTQLYGTYNLPNIAFAICVGEYFGVEQAEIIEAISEYTPDNNRSQILKIDTNIIIKDAYNANPSSMVLSIESFSKILGSKVVVLGDMLELGEYAPSEHQKIIDLVNDKDFIDVIFIGHQFCSAGMGKRGNYFENTDLARLYFHTKNYKNITILLKGSRGISVEKIL